MAGRLMAARPGPLGIGPDPFLVSNFQAGSPAGRPARVGLYTTGMITWPTVWW